jgi:tripartite-type tricarboxylate transporter receptor subunit TctC
MHTRDMGVSIGPVALGVFARRLFRARLCRAAIAGCAAMALVQSVPALAQRYPDKPIRLILGFPAGGATDVIGRAIAQRLSAQFGQQIVVDNRAGADSLIASQLVARAEPNGYTLYLASTAHAINPSLYKGAQYDAVKDFTAISLIGEVPNLVVVNVALPAKTLAELIAYAKTKKGQLNYATTASVTYLATELLTRAAGIEVQRVAYKGAAPAMTALLGGEVQMMVSGIGPLLPHVKSGKLRALAITSEKRSAAAPDIPTVIEAGVPGYASSVWYGLMAPAGMRRELVDLLYAESKKALADTELQNALAIHGIEIRGTSPKEFDAFLRAEVRKWDKVVKDTGAQAS